MAERSATPGRVPKYYVHPALLQDINKPHRAAALRLERPARRRREAPRRRALEEVAVLQFLQEERQPLTESSSVGRRPHARCQYRTPS